MPLPARTIALEEHAVFPALGASSAFYNAIWRALPEAEQKLWDHASQRIADMDSAHMTFQVMSHIPGIGLSNVSGCRGANTEMAAAIRKSPLRLGGFAVLPMAHPDAAATELERAVIELGLLGALVDNHLEDGTHYDDEKYWPVFAKAEQLDVPIYLHPSPMSEDAMKKVYAGNYPGKVALGLSTGAWGWHEDVGLHVLKLYAAGLFDRFPKLKIIIGHMGEMLPFMLDRANRLAVFSGQLAPGRRTLKQVWDENIWVTTSGMFSLNPMATLLRTTRVERILYSVDYPFEDIQLGWKFLEELGSSGMVTEKELNMIAAGNAEKLLKLKIDSSS